ncbi:GatB/YqeY domain-containing protein [Mechercharimyces sp. CAU 1602]|uniref:GatB/YqeY domain-containing protein n=1 Tax=Mechercharimyces sp. CAU 1602 TaxID=2973933 RepID=UPI002162B019|nr:GatB/YqeY domain-containing protein [Mechercharimyces sp. CAU 1602]MCS1350464.1 GatB/YqeY domain-containing protein [Mechercharimyces sp. CAU 1602]
MSMMQQLQDEMKIALKEKDKPKLNVIRRLRSAMKNQEIEQKQPLTAEEELDVVVRELKQVKDSLFEFEKAGRADLVEAMHAEVSILTDYLPQALTEEELLQQVDLAVQEVGASSKADMGKVMGILLPRVKGRADAKKVSQLVQQRLS